MFTANFRGLAAAQLLARLGVPGLSQSIIVHVERWRFPYVPHFRKYTKGPRRWRAC